MRLGQRINAKLRNEVASPIYLEAHPADSHIYSKKPGCGEAFSTWLRMNAVYFS